MTRYLVATYDVSALDEGEIDALTLEAAVQGESSDGHRSVPVEISRQDDDLVTRLRAAFEVAHDRSSLKLGDEDIDVYFEEVVRALGLEKSC